MANINSYSDKFKKQIVALYESGKSVSYLTKEYNIAKATTYKWIKQSTNLGSFNTKDKHCVKENELIKLRKELKQLRRENRILKPAAINDRQKVKIIFNNKSKYRIRTMCRFLKLSKSTYYFNLNKKEKNENNIYKETVSSAFKENK